MKDQLLQLIMMNKKKDGLVEYLVDYLGKIIIYLIMKD